MNVDHPLSKYEDIPFELLSQYPEIIHGDDEPEMIRRASINQELNALVDELDRISTTTQFNKQNLLDGTFTNKKLQVGANKDQYIGVSIGNMKARDYFAYKTQLIPVIKESFAKLCEIADIIVIEGKLGKIINWKPLCFCSIVLTFDFLR